MLIRFPDHAHAGTTVSQFGSGVDVLPTLLEILGVEADASLPGMSLVSAIRSGEAARDHVTCTTCQAMMIRTATKKLWYDVEHNDGEMNDLDRDPNLLENLFDRAEASDIRSQLFEIMMKARMSDDLRYSVPTEREKRLHGELRTAHEPEI